MDFDPSIATQTIALHVELEDEGRTQTLTVRFSTHPGSEFLRVDDMAGLNDLDIQEIVQNITCPKMRGLLLDLAGGTFVDMRAPGLPRTSRLYRDGGL